MSAEHFETRSTLDLVNAMYVARGVEQIGWVYDDGGRAEAGFKGKKMGDCVCRAIAIAAQRPYAQIHAELSALGWNDKPSRYWRDADGLIIPGEASWRVEREFIASLGWQWHPVMRIGSGCKMHLRADELPAGRIIARVTGHLVAVIDGVIHDTYDCSRAGTRCVYGYFAPGNVLDAVAHATAGSAVATALELAQVPPQ